MAQPVAGTSTWTYSSCSWLCTLCTCAQPPLFLLLELPGQGGTAAHQADGHQSRCSDSVTPYTSARDSSWMLWQLLCTSERHEATDDGANGAAWQASSTPSSISRGLPTNSML